MACSFKGFFRTILMTGLLSLAIGCDRSHKSHPVRKVKPSSPAVSQEKVKASESIDKSFKVGSSEPNSNIGTRLNSANPPKLTVPEPLPPATSSSKVPAPLPNPKESKESKSLETNKKNDSNSKETPTSPESKQNTNEISIAKAALNKEFLLQGALIPQNKIALGRSIKSRVVAFEAKGKTLVMLEATQGHSLNSEFPQKLVLATFPILKQDKDFVTFDFNVGMSRLITLRDWYAKDFSGVAYSPDKQFASFQVVNSFIESAEFDQSNHLVIRQISLMNNNATTTEKAAIRVPVEVKYYLSPYKPSANYQPFHSPSRFDELGYFEVNPQLSANGVTLNYASRFHPENPIVFAISANTPKEYSEAIEQGVLYWNKALGKTLVKVIHAPEGIRAPDANYNVAQWVNWDYAGSAYADGQMDPRTGEILHAQAFITSAFAFSGKNKAREILRKLEHGDSPLISITLTPELKGLEEEDWCHLEYKETLKEALEEVVNSDLSDASILKMSQDYIRTVVAHEIGHTLGLRHNFAGSLAATYSSEQRSQLFKDYLKTGSTPTTVTYSSSIMDYHRIEEAAMLGDLILKMPDALTYDYKAIQNLYFNKTIELDKQPLFCTDSHADVNGYADCKRFDFGASAIEFAKWKITHELESLPNFLIEKYIRNKTDPLQPSPLKTEQVPLETTSALASSLLESQNDLLKLLTLDRALLSVDRQFPQIDERTESEVKAAYTRYLEAEVERLGGLEVLFTLIPTNYSHVSIEKVKTLLADPHYQSGIGYNGQAFELSKEESEKITTDLSVYLKKLNGALLFTELKNFKTTQFGKDSGSKISKFANNKLSQDLATILKTKISLYVLTTTDELVDTEFTKAKTTSAEIAGTASSSVPSGDIEKTAIKLPVFKYPTEIRAYAAGIFGNERGEDLMWGMAEKADIQKSLKQLMDQSLTTNFETIDLTQQNSLVQRWIIENKRVFTEFNR